MLGSHDPGAVVGRVVAIVEMIAGPQVRIVQVVHPANGVVVGERLEVG